MATLGNSNGPEDIVAFHHAALFSPTVSTLQTAMKKGFLPNLPGLTERTLAKHSPNLQYTAMGHMDNIWKNIQSTKRQKLNPPHEKSPGDTYPRQPPPTKREHINAT
jgi:hypothetical protein